MSYRSRILLGAVLVITPVQCLAQGDPRPRVFIEQSESWALGGWSPFFGLLAAGGGARPQTAEIINTFAKRCPAVTPTLQRENAAYIVLLEREGGKGLFRKDNKYAVFTAFGDLVKSGSTRMLGNAVGEACQAITSRTAGP